MKKITLLLVFSMITLLSSAQQIRGYTIDYGNSTSNLIKKQIDIEVLEADATITKHHKNRTEVQKFVYSHTLREYGKTTLVYRLENYVGLFSPTELLVFTKKGVILGYYERSYLGCGKHFVFSE